MGNGTGRNGDGGRRGGWVGCRLRDGKWVSRGKIITLFFYTLNFAISNEDSWVLTHVLDHMTNRTSGGEEPRNGEKNPPQKTPTPK